MENHIRSACLFAGVPALNRTLYHRIGLAFGDPVVLIEEAYRATIIVRDIEMHRAKKKLKKMQVHCPSEFVPRSGFSGDRETAMAQSMAECLLQKGIHQVEVDRTFPQIFAHQLQKKNIDYEYNSELGVLERRVKTEREIEHLRHAQKITSEIVARACECVAKAEAKKDGSLESEGIPLSSERLRMKIDLWLLKSGFSNPGSIVACGSEAADCHALGSGILRTGEPIIIDIFPCDKSSFYNGDCTRTVVHGEVSDEVCKMHKAVVEANLAAKKATRAGVKGEVVHEVAVEIIQKHGFKWARPSHPFEPFDLPTMTHGTGHGIGLEVHESPLLDFKGPRLLKGDALTIEPGLYSKIGGVRIEDLVIVTEKGCESLNENLPIELDWS